MLYSIVIPVYNSANVLKELVLRIETVFQQYANDTIEIVFVDDNSSDESWNVLKGLRQEKSSLKIIKLSKNYGQHNALFCGFERVSGDYVITMDDDLQHPPEEIPKLISAIQGSDYDVIIAEYQEKKHSHFRNIGTKLIDRLLSVFLDKRRNLKLTSFRIINRETVEKLNKLNHYNPKVNVSLLQITNRIDNVVVNHNERKSGKSGYSYLKLLKTFFFYIIDNSMMPLRVMSYFGILSFVLSMMLLAYYLVNYFIRGISIVGWTTIVALVLMFGGLQLLCIGLLGEYLMKILLETKRIPRYFVREEH